MVSRLYSDASHAKNILGADIQVAISIPNPIISVTADGALKMKPWYLVYHPMMAMPILMKSLYSDMPRTLSSLQFVRNRTGLIDYSCRGIISITLRF